MFLFLLLFFCTGSQILAHLHFHTSLDGAAALGGVAGLILSPTTLSAAACFTQKTDEAPGIHLLRRHFESFHPPPPPTAAVGEGACLYQLYRSSNPSIKISAQQMTGMMIEMTLTHG